MAMVIMTCGRLCCGKSTYARQLQKHCSGVILSIDELMMTMFSPYCGDDHDQLVCKSEQYLYGLSVQLVQAGTNVILDWGYWTREKRQYARDFYSSQGIPFRFDYLEVDPENWHRRIEQRNQAVLAGQSHDYYVDENLLMKFESIFEPPSADETDVQRPTDSIGFIN